MKFARVCAAAALLVTVLTALLWLPALVSTSVPEAAQSQSAAPALLRQSVQAPKHHEPIPLSEEELTALLAPVHPTTHIGACVTDHVLKPGEIKVTSGYTTENGEHLFSVLRPVPKVREDGRRSISVLVERYYLRAGGDVKPLFSTFMWVNPGSLTGSSYGGSLHQGGEHRLEMKAEITDDGNIRLRTREFDAHWDKKGNLLNDPGEPLE